MNFAGVFPGQGSQSIGMLAALAGTHREVTDTFTEASEMLRYDLWQVCQTGPEEQLNRTECTQPAMLAAGTAVWRVWCVRGGPTPDVMGGHSLGEYTALVCAGGLGFADAVALVADRGRFMQEAVPYGEGAVAAILGLDDTRVIEACEEAAQGEVIRAVNFNAPGQVVVAGHTGAVERALEIARARGARKALRLPLSVPVHSPLMKPAAMRFAQRLADCRFSVPPVPVVSNVDLRAHASVDGIRENLAKQLYSPVRWSETIEGFHRQGVTLVVESGPGKVLAGLNRRIARDMRAHALVDVESIDTAIIALGESP